jgi:FtsP/CotA-like multicopper oxidase with cupredoxin domain
VKVHPGQVTRIRARFDLPSAFAGTRQTYVHHCHIVEHEDNDMMASFTVD